MTDAKKNKQGIKDVMYCIDRPGMKDLYEHMCAIGFFDAPCSGGNHLCKPGGLAKHTDNVMQIAMTLANIFGVDEQSAAIVSICHDLGKCGQFGKANYIPNMLKSGSQSTTKPFLTNPELLYVPHEIRSVQIANKYIELTEEENFAIVYHNGMYGDLRFALKGKETPLYLILHFADMWASRVEEVE